jgi:hypothetical protein
MNRRQRRAAAAAPNSPSDGISSASDIPLARPPSSTSTKPKAKTLYEIAAERQAELAPHGQPFPKDTKQNSNTSTSSEATKLVTLSPNGEISEATPTTTSSDLLVTEPPNPILDTLLLSFPLSCLHFTLSFLAAHQYAQQDLVSLPALLKQTIIVAFPTLTLLIHIFHGHALPQIRNTSTFSPRIRAATRVALQILYLIIANIAGCYLIYLTNDKGYYAVMKRAPAIGTLWVWCIIELGLLGSLGGIVGPGLFAWWNGYGVF